MLQLDYNFIASTTSVVAVIITLVIFIIEARHSNLALKTELLLNLQEKFDASEFREIRKTAARKLLNREDPNYELSDVLDFFASIGFLYQRKAIDQDLAFNNFSYWMIRYWLCSEEYIAQERQVDILGWVTLEKITIVLMKREMKSGYPPYTKELLTRFLQEEGRLLPRG